MRVVSHEDHVFMFLGHEARRRLLVLLHDFGEMCVCDIVSALALPQAVVSRHLARGRDLRFVIARRAGPWVYYSLAPELPSWFMTMLLLLRETGEGGLFAADAQRLASVPRVAVSCALPRQTRRGPRKA